MGSMIFKFDPSYWLSLAPQIDLPIHVIGRQDIIPLPSCASVNYNRHNPETNEEKKAGRTSANYTEPRTKGKWTWELDPTGKYMQRCETKKLTPPFDKRQAPPTTVATTRRPLVKRSTCWIGPDFCSCYSYDGEHAPGITYRILVYHSPDIGQYMGLYFSWYHIYLPYIKSRSSHILLKRPIDRDLMQTYHASKLKRWHFLMPYQSNLI